MCWSCPCGSLESSHGDSRSITTETLQSAADQAGTDLGHVIGNIVVGLSHYDPNFKKSEEVVYPYATCDVIKAAPERQFTLGVAYPAMTPDVSVAADGFRDFVSAEALEKTAHEWMHKYRDVNLFHKDGTSGHFTPAESYIYRGPDWEIQSPVDNNIYVVKAGAWMLGGYWDDYGWTLVKAGLINGWSPEGTATRSVPTAERLAELRS